MDEYLSTSSTHPVLLRVPKLYENMDEATVGEWLVQEGELVNEGQLIVELITDKRTEQIPTTKAGRLLSIIAREKSVVPVGYILAVIGQEMDSSLLQQIQEENERLLKLHLEQTQGNSRSILPSNETVSQVPPDRPKHQIRIAPAARVLAKQHGLDPEQIAKILKKEVLHRKDIEDYLILQDKQHQLSPTHKESHPVSSPVILITGASGDIGQAIVQRLASEEYRLIVHGYQHTERLTQIQKEQNIPPSRYWVFEEDLCNLETIQSFVQKVYQIHSQLDVLVHCIGILTEAPFLYMTEEEWRRTLRINLDIAFYLSQAVLSYMVKAHQGKIIFLGSDAGDLGSAGHSAYAAAKAGLVGLAKSLAREFAMSGIEINVVAPGFIESRMTQHIHPVKRQQIQQQIPARRFGKPSEVAEAVAFLVHPSVHYITGQVLHIDGGLVMV